MAKNKLFAMEELDEAGSKVEMEASPEAGEVADVQVDVEQEIGEVAESGDAIEEGMGAADQMKQVEDVVADAAEGEGLDPVAAEAIRIAVEAICARVGANPKSVYALYATENFQSASSRKANTKIALEGVGEFLKDLWKKIKAAMQNLWTKIKAFWDKHMSSLGRVKKALESMKKTVGESSGKLKDKAYIDEASSGMKEAFGFLGDVSTKTVGEVITAHSQLIGTSADLVTKTEQFNSKAAANVTDVSAAITSLTGGVGKDREVSGLVGGLELKYVFEIDTDESDVTLTVERENAEKKDKVGLSLAEKASVKTMLEDMLAVINDNIKAKEKLTKFQESFNKFSMTIEKKINEASNQATNAADLRKSMKVTYKLNAKVPVIFTEALGLNIRLAKAVLGFASVCVKNYK